MILDENYEMKIVIVEDRDGIPGSVYDDFSKFKKDHPNSGYRYGFCIVNRKTGLIPDACNDWNDSPEEAMFDYFDNVLP